MIFPWHLIFYSLPAILRVYLTLDDYVLLETNALQLQTDAEMVGPLTSYLGEVVDGVMMVGQVRRISVEEDTAYCLANVNFWDDLAITQAL